MTKETTGPDHSFFENLGHSIDFTFKMAAGSEIRAIAINDDKEIVPAGSSHTDILMVFSKGDKREIVSFSQVMREMFSGDRFEVDEGWCKQLVMALGRNPDQWYEYYEFSDLIFQACYLHSETPEFGDSEEHRTAETQWVYEICWAISNEQYKYVWDQEAQRDWGEAHFKEWNENTAELRGGRRFKW